MPVRLAESAGFCFGVNNAVSVGCFVIHTKWEEGHIVAHNVIKLCTCVTKSKKVFFKVCSCLHKFVHLGGNL